MTSVCESFTPSLQFLAEVRGHRAWQQMLLVTSCVRWRVEGSDTAVLDFNDTVGAVFLVGESRLTLRRLQLERLASVTDGYTSGSYVSMTSMLWPSINAAPGSKVRGQCCLSRVSAQAATVPYSQCHGGRGLMASVSCAASSSSCCWHASACAALPPSCASVRTPFAAVPKTCQGMVQFPLALASSACKVFPDRHHLWPQFHLDSTVTYFLNRHHGNCTAGTIDRAAMLQKARSKCKPVCEWVEPVPYRSM